VGDVHLVLITGKEIFNGMLYVALVVCQSRKGGQVSPIHFGHLQTGLLKVAQEAIKLGASVHLPRIGADMPTINYYSVERMIRNTVAARGIKTYIYYFQRQNTPSKSLTTTPSHTPSKSLTTTPSHTPSKSLTTTPSHTPSKSLTTTPIISSKTITTQSLPTTTTSPMSPPIFSAENSRNTTSTKRKFSDTIDDDRFQNESPYTKKQKKQQNLDQCNSLNVDKKQKTTEKFEETFQGKYFHFFQVGNDFEHLKEVIERHGGCIHYKIQKNTTYIVSGETKNKLLKMIQSNFKSLETVSISWVYQQVISRYRGNNLLVKQ